MYSLAVINSMNARKEVATIKAAAEKPARREHSIRVEVGGIEVGDRNRYGIDGLILHVSKKPNKNGNFDEGSYYVNHTAGFQRWHSSGCTRVEAIGYCKQVGVTEKEFLHAFPWNYKRSDPINNIKVPKIECEECGDKVDFDDSVFADDTTLCNDCCCSGTCDNCGEYYGSDNLTHGENESMCEYCKDKKEAS